MTNAIEQSKREMYRRISYVRRNPSASGYYVNNECIDAMEESLEAHLELLRQDLSALHETARKRFEDIQSLEAVNKDLIEQLSSMTEKRDALRNSAQASAHACGSSHSVGSTSGQISAENASCAKLDGKTAAILGAVVDVRQIVSDWAVYGYKAKKQMKKLAYAINNNPELHAAMLQFEKGDGYGTWFLNNTDCMHSFHPAFPSGEQCVFCGVGK